MNAVLPLCCSPTAFGLLSRQMPFIDSSDALLAGAVAIAMHQMEDADVSAVDSALQRLADLVRSRVRGRQPQALLAHLHDVLFEEEGFAGNTADYYNPVNSYLPTVLESKKGLPITLSLIYKTVAERLGLRAWGVGLPGHFLTAVDVGGSTMLIDPFMQGREVTVDEAHGRMKEIFGEEMEWTDQLIAPAPNKHWLTRMLQNLLNLFGSNEKYSDVAAVLEMEILLWPEEHRLQRDLALVLARLGLSQSASAWLSKYLNNNPDDPQTPDLRQLLDVLARPDGVKA